MMQRRKLVLENGMSFPGTGCGKEKDCAGEIVVYTSVADGLELISDPSFAGEIIAVPYCTGFESTVTGNSIPYIKGFVSGNSQKQEDLSRYLEERDVSGIFLDDISTLADVIRKNGRMCSAIVGEDTAPEQARRLMEECCRETNWAELTAVREPLYLSARNPRHHAVILDCGMKPGIAEELQVRGCSVTIVPYTTDVADIEALHPDGILISSGPGNPVQMTKVIQTINTLKGKYPIFGICLGQELIALSYGAKIIDLGCGHHGEQPVSECFTGNNITVAHNHNFAVDEKTAVECGLSVTHKNVSDGVIEGLENKKDRIFSVQYHPEGRPGTKDGSPFDKFTGMMDKG